MSLPVGKLPTDSVEVNGSSVNFRSLSRAEVLRLQDMIRAGNYEAAEVYTLVCGTGDTEEGVKAWRESTMTEEASKLVDGILITSGLATAEAIAAAEETGEQMADPKQPMNGPSLKDSSTPTSSP